MLNIMPDPPEYYDVIPEYNSAGRLCNYHTGGEGDTVRVMADEWERFNRLAGRQHHIEDGTVVYDATLEPCLPDPPKPDRLTVLQTTVDNMLGVT